MKIVHTATFAHEVARLAAAALTQRLAQTGRAVLALSGGRTPAAYLPALFAAPLDWSRVVLTQVDDRIVPADHADSNARLIAELRAGTPAAAAGFVPLVDGVAPADAVARKAAAALERAAAYPPDVVLLGMGEDGHTASLFPALAPDLTTAAPCIGVPLPPPPNRHPRVSLSLRALGQARCALLAVQGAAKAAVLQRQMTLHGSILGTLAAIMGERLSALVQD